MLDFELEKKIAIIASDGIPRLDLSSWGLTHIPESLGKFTNFTSLFLEDNDVTFLPSSLENLTDLTHLSLAKNKLNLLPVSLGNLTNLKYLSVDKNQLESLPETLGNLTNLNCLSLQYNNLTFLPESLGSLTNLTSIFLRGNQLKSLSESLIKCFTKLDIFSIDDNPLTDLSPLQGLPKKTKVDFLGVNLPRRYWTKLSEWKPQWLLDERNAEIRRVLIQQVGYEKICQELAAVKLNSWREYTLLKIKGKIDVERIVLLKMTCPSTGYIHVVRVPPNIKSAEEAITWVNWGIHPDEFAIAT